MKKITHLLYSGLGGHGSVFFSLTEADTRKEYEYHAIFTGIEQVREEYVKQCHARTIPFDFVLKKQGLDLPVYWKLARKIHAGKPAVVFLHGPSFILSAFLCKLIRPGMKIRVRDTQAHHLKSRMDWFWLGLVIILAGKIVVLTKEAGEGIINKYKWLPVSKKLVVIPNGLNIEKYKPENKISHPGIIIGMQSRLQKIKDHPALLESFARLCKDLPGQQLTLAIAGDGETMNSLQALAKELGIADRVQFHGMLNEQQLLSFMHSLDIYVHATFGETMSNSIMQAMACGLPVIASDVWGVNNMISHKNNGWLYPSQDIPALTSAMSMLVTNKQERERLGKASLSFATGNYSFASMFEKYKNLY